MAYHVRGAMLEAYHKLYPKPESITDIKEALQMIWGSLPQEPINEAVKSFTLCVFVNRLQVLRALHCRLGWRFGVAVARWSRSTQLLYIEPG